MSYDFRNRRAADQELVDRIMSGEDANLQGVDLRNANLKGAILTGADLTDADLTRANLQGVKYDANTVWPQGFTPPAESRMASRVSRNYRFR
jgi:uncharacterized protein YjbI with pentapeptide repeats